MSSSRAAASPGRPFAARVPPWLIVAAGMICFQTGAAVAKGLFAQLPPASVVLLRTGFGAVVLLALWRPRVRGLRRRDRALVAAFGASLAAMNFSFYQALDRIPLGIAVTIEFVGPLGVAVLSSRRWLDGLWVLLAGGGVVLLTKGGGHLAPLGIAFAVLAGLMWGTYILLNKRVGAAFPQGAGLALALGVSTLLLLAPGIAAGGAKLGDPRLLALGALVSLLSSFIPYSLELEALRRMPVGTFGVLMSLEPAMAALIGFLLLGERLDPIQLVAIGLVVVASAGATRLAPTSAELPA